MTINLIKTMLQKEGCSCIVNLETNKITCMTCVSVWLCACLHECWSPIGVLFPFCCCLASFSYGQLAHFFVFWVGGWGVALYVAVTSLSIRNLWNQQKSSIPICITKMLGTALTPLQSSRSTPFLLHSYFLLQQWNQQCTKLNSCLDCK